RSNPTLHAGDWLVVVPVGRCFALGVLMSSYPLLSILTFVTVVGAAIVAGAPRAIARQIAVIISIIASALAICVWAGLGPANPQMQFVERGSWISSLGIEFHLGIDGLGLLMILLSAFIIPFAMLASWRIQQNPKLYFALLLLLETGLFGTFTALNFFHWFI